MRDRLSEWQLQRAESASMYGVEELLQQLAVIGSATQRDQHAAQYAERENQPLCAYDLAETANRRRAIIQEYQLSYAKIARGMQFALSNQVSFELAKNFMASNSLTWFLEIAPVLMAKNIINADMYFRLSIAVLGINATRADMNKLTASVIRKAGLFKGEASGDNGVLVAQYRERAGKFKEYLVEPVTHPRLVNN